MAIVSKMPSVLFVGFILLLILSLFGVVAGALAGTANVVAVPQQHAVMRHGSEAEMVREACSMPTTEHLFFKQKNGRYGQLCRLLDGRWGYQVIKLVKNHWIEITSFIPKDGSYEKAIAYLQRQGAVRIQSLPNP